MITDEQIEEAERLLSYYEIHAPALPFWTEDAVTFLRELLPDWSAFKRDLP